MNYNFNHLEILSDKYFTKDFYFCFDKVVRDYKDKYNWIIAIGGRRMGKTYSILKFLIEEADKGRNFLYMRRTQKEIDLSVTEIGNPFRSINMDMKRNIYPTGKKNGIGFFSDGNDENVIGYACGLSTISSLRGYDMSDVYYIFLDEFINMNGVDSLKGKTFLNLMNVWQTVDNNREMRGKQAVKVILASNSNHLNDDIIFNLKLAEVIRKIKTAERKECYAYFNDEKRYVYIDVYNKGFRDKADETAISAMSKGTSYYEMAFENSFADDYMNDVKKFNLHEFDHLVSFENVYFYKHKSRNFIYCSRSRFNDVPRFYRNTVEDFKRNYGLLLYRFITSGRCFYQDYDLKIECENIW